MYLRRECVYQRKGVIPVVSKSANIERTNGDEREWEGGLGAAYPDSF